MNPIQCAINNTLNFAEPFSKTIGLDAKTAFTAYKLDQPVEALSNAGLLVNIEVIKTDSSASSAGN